MTRTLMALVFLTASVIPVRAQTNTGEISGFVRDAQGGVLPGATIRADHVASGARVERATDYRGRYLLPSLRVGTYHISVEL